jgi:hypothetical protein
VEWMDGRSRRRWLTTPVGVLLALSAATSRAHAQNLEPRAYANTPIGVNFALLGYAYSEGGVTTDPSIPLTNADLHVHQAFVGFARALDLWGLSGKFAAALPYAWLSGTADFMGQPRERDVSGFGDPRLQLSVNVYGAPALSLKEFEDYKQDVIIGASLQVAVPVGQYDSDKAVNIGTHRWAVKPEVGVSKAWGPLIVELMAGVTFYTDNGAFLGNHTRAQDPLYSLQAHVIYSLPFGDLGGAGRHVLRRRPHDHRWRTERRSKRKYPPGRDRLAPGRSAQLGQDLREHRRHCPHRNRLHHGRHRLAISLGRRLVARGQSSVQASRPRRA